MNSITIYGLHAVIAMLKTRPQDVMKLVLLPGAEKQLSDACGKTLAKIPIERSKDRKLLDDFSEGVSHQGAVAICRPAQTHTEEWLKSRLQSVSETTLFLVLDGVQDPHNLGACLRTASAAGVTAVIIPKDRAVGLTPVVRKVSVGASELMPLVQVTNLARTMKDLKEAGVWLYGLAGEAKVSVYKEKFAGATGIIMGAEGSGLRRLTRENCDGLVNIPMPGLHSSNVNQTGSDGVAAQSAAVDSLNVSVATGVALFEVQRQRGLLVS